MSSSGLIYAGIVGAWAVYLVPVWLRREEQLNQAREKARYAAAIRTLGRPEQFEKRWAQDEALAATGTDGPTRIPASSTGASTSTAAKKAARPAGLPTGDTGADGAADAAADQTRTRPQDTAKGGVKGAKGPKKAGTRIDVGDTVESPHTKPLAPVRAGRTPGPVLAASQRRRQTVTARLTPAEQHQARRRGALLMRRRRMVATLFVLTTVGAVASVLLGVDYIGAMLAPAVLMSLYIVRIRRDERQRAQDRSRRRQARLAAERRRDRERALGDAQAAVQDAHRDAPAWRPSVEPEDFRRAANG